MDTQQHELIVRLLTVRNQLTNLKDLHSRELQREADITVDTGANSSNPTTRQNFNATIHCCGDATTASLASTQASLLVILSQLREQVLLLPQMLPHATVTRVSLALAY